MLKLEGVRFDWKPQWAKERPGREHDIGFVAEDVEKVFPEVVFYDENGNVTGMDFSRLTAVAVQAIKELKAENDDLRTRLERLEAKLK
ncbi:MAG TPA: tail fiber domain-containing protein [Phycisphaerales bacterium]